MNQTQLDEAIIERGLEDYRDFIFSSAKPSVGIVIVEREPDVCSSKFGGPPDVPSNFEWPRHAAGLCKFLGQFNLASMPPDTDLPKSGLLSIFFMADEEGYQYWREDEPFLRVYHFQNLAELRPMPAPEPVDLGPCFSVDLVPGLELPDKEWCKAHSVPWPITDMDHLDEWWELRLQLHPSNCYFFGYPCNGSLCYDPTPGTDWQSLLTCHSLDEMDWGWHDGDWLVSFIPKEKLLVGDFSQIAADAG